MNSRLIACAALSFLVLSAHQDFVAGSADEPTTKEAGVVRLISTRTPQKLAARVITLMAISSETELGRFVSGTDCTDALAVAWERVRRTMPEIARDDNVVPDARAISRFLGFVEGRLHVIVPTAWELAVKSALGSNQKMIFFQYEPPMTPKRMADRWDVGRDGAHWLVKKGSHSIKIAAEPHEIVVDPVVEEAEGTAYVALCDPSATSSYRLVAIDRSSSNAIWCTKVWGARVITPPGFIFSNSGPDYHVVELRLSPESIFVFGLSGAHIYLESFDRKTGENRCRFSTSYFRDYTSRG